MERTSREVANYYDTVLIATTNKGKLSELREIFSIQNIRVLGLDEFCDYTEPEETGEMFCENALIKARAAAKYAGLVSVADDSGLIVDALNGAPGVYSARYASDIPSFEGESMDARNIRKLLANLKNVDLSKRTAKFHCCIAVASPFGEDMLSEGDWHGEILFEPRGKNGFGYDPVFYDSDLKKTAAELLPEEKNAISHRSKALRGLMIKWEEFWSKAKLH